MRFRRLSLLLLLIAAGLLGACRTENEPAPKEIFGSGPRIPDDQGIATGVDFERITLDDKRSYNISSEVQSFSTYDGTVTPLLHHKGRYVQLGLEKREVEWVAGIGILQADQTVFYNGTVEKVDRKTLTFEDGTVLKMTNVVQAPGVGQRIRARIAPAKQGIIEIVPQ